MIAEKILSKKPITIPEANDLLKEIVKERKEPSYEQDMSLKYFEKLGKISASKAEKLLEELKKIEGVDEALAVKLVDVMPESKEVVQLLLPKNSKVSESEVEKILSAVKKYLK